MIQTPDTDANYSNEIAHTLLKCNAMGEFDYIPEPIVDSEVTENTQGRTCRKD